MVVAAWAEKSSRTEAGVRKVTGGVGRGNVGTSVKIGDS